MHNALAFRHLSKNAGSWRDQKVRLLEILVSGCGDWVPIHDFGHNRGDGKSLLAGCSDGCHCRLFGVFVQSSVPGAFTFGRFASMGIADGETHSFNGRNLPSAWWKTLSERFQPVTHGHRSSLGLGKRATISISGCRLCRYPFDLHIVGAGSLFSMAYSARDHII